MNSTSVDGFESNLVNSLYSIDFSVLFFSFHFLISLCVFIEFFCSWCVVVDVASLDCLSTL